MAARRVVVADLCVHPRSAGTRLPRLPPPEHLDSLPMPMDHRLRLHDQQAGSPACPHPREPAPEHPITSSEFRTLHRSLEDGELLPEGQFSATKPARPANSTRRSPDVTLKTPIPGPPRSTERLSYPSVSLVARIDVSSCVPARSEFSVGTTSVRSEEDPHTRGTAGSRQKGLHLRGPLGPCMRNDAHLRPVSACLLKHSTSHTHSSRFAALTSGRITCRAGTFTRTPYFCT